jgi:hypothetical protein
MAAQIPDIIFVSGEKMDLYSNPLEQYWIRQDKKRPAFYTFSSCTRGYVATWEIIDKQLILKNIDGSVERRTLLFGKESVRFTLGKLFSKAGRKGVKAGWFSGKLRIPRGNMTMYDHNGYDSRFEKEIIITVDHGNVIKMVTLDYTRQTLIVNTTFSMRKPNLPNLEAR